jgi:hypothetical protein
MNWTFDEYLNQPAWFLEEVIIQLNDETKKQKRELRRNNVQHS